jgi:HlyD family secretion protein
MMLGSDRAGIAGAKANLEKARVDVVDKQRKVGRQRELNNSGLTTRDDLETAQAVLEATIAAQNATEAQLQSAEAGFMADEARLQQARAALQTAKLNLDHTRIYSPISGTNIDEADVGKIRKGMEAEFTVDAYPEEVFTGAISQVRLAATTVQNVVTYNAIFSVANPEQRLKPGMTASVKILIDQVSDSLKIPNSALRFKPAITEMDMAELFRQAGEEEYWRLNRDTLAGAQKSLSGAKAPTPEASKTPPDNATAGGDGRGSGLNGSSQPDGRGSGPGQSGSPGLEQGGQKAARQVPVWLLSGVRNFRPVVVQVGLSDGVNTQLVSGNLKEGDKLVTGVAANSKRLGTASATTQTPKSGGAPPPPPPP